MEALNQEALYYLYEAEQCLLRIQPIDDFMLIFEADDLNVQNTVQQNAQNYGQSEGFLKKAANAIMGIIRGILDAIRNFFSYSFASKENKEKFQAFKQKCLSDPTLANKTIRYIDYKQQLQEYDQAIQNAEAIDQQLAAGQDVEVDGIVQNLTNLAKGAAKGIATSIGLRTLEDVVTADQGAAEAVQTALNLDQQFLGGVINNSIANQVGDKNAANFQKNVAAASGQDGIRIPLIGKRLSIRRGIVLLRRKKEATLEETMKNTFNELKTNFTNPFNLVFSATFGKLKYAKGNEELQEIANSKYAQYGKNMIMDKAKSGLVGKIKDVTRISKVENAINKRRHEKAIAQKEKTRQQSRNYFFGGNKQQTN